MRFYVGSSPARVTVDNTHMELTLSNLEFLRPQEVGCYKGIVEDNSYGIHPSSIIGHEVVDIGAHVGIFSLYTATLGAETVFAFEPVNAHYSQLVNNISQFPGAKIYPYEVAIFNGIQKRVSISGEGTRSHVGGGEKLVQAWQLSMVNDLLILPDPVLKIDCEGAEYDILFHASSVDIRKYKHIFIDAHEKSCDEIHPEHSLCRINVIIDYLNFLGFRETARQDFWNWVWDGQGNLVQHNRLDCVALGFERIGS